MCITTPTLFRKKCSKEEKFLECVEPAEGSPPDLEPHSQMPQALHTFGGFVFLVFVFVLFCFEKRAHRIALADLELTRSACRCLSQSLLGLKARTTSPSPSFTCMQSSEELTNSVPPSVPGTMTSGESLQLKC